MPIPPDGGLCRIPVRATYRIVNGKPVKTAAEYADIPATVIAEKILGYFGLDPTPTRNHKEQED